MTQNVHHPTRDAKEERFLDLVEQADDDLKCIIMLMMLSLIRKDRGLFDGLVALGHMKPTDANGENPLVADFAGLPSMAAAVPESERLWWARLAWKILEANDRPRWEFLIGLMHRRMAC